MPRLLVGKRTYIETMAWHGFDGVACHGTPPKPCHATVSIIVRFPTKTRGMAWHGKTKKMVENIIFSTIF